MKMLVINKSHLKLKYERHFWRHLSYFDRTIINDLIRFSFSFSFFFFSSLISFSFFSFSFSWSFSFSSFSLSSFWLFIDSLIELRLSKFKIRRITSCDFVWFFVLRTRWTIFILYLLWIINCKKRIKRKFFQRCDLITKLKRFLRIQLLIIQYFLRIHFLINQYFLHFLHFLHLLYAYFFCIRLFIFLLLFFQFFSILRTFVTILINIVNASEWMYVLKIQHFFFLSFLLNHMCTRKSQRLLIRMSAKRKKNFNIICLETFVELFSN